MFYMHSFGVCIQSTVNSSSLFASQAHIQLMDEKSGGCSLSDLSTWYSWERTRVAAQRGGAPEPTPWCLPSAVAHHV